jgi:hypothetical protein
LSYSSIRLKLKWEKVNIDLYKALTDLSIDALNKTTRTLNDTEHLPEKICTIMNEAATKSTTVKAKYIRFSLFRLFDAYSLSKIFPAQYSLRVYYICWIRWFSVYHRKIEQEIQLINQLVKNKAIPVATISELGKSIKSINTGMSADIYNITIEHIINLAKQNLMLMIL